MRRSLKVVCAAVALAGLLAGCGGAGQPASGGAWAAERTQRSAANASLSAELDPARHVDGGYSYCVEQASRQLKAPATAEFSSKAESHPTINGSHMVFSGTVDAQNSFGALLRSTWDCDITWMGGNTYVGQAVVHEGQ